MELHANHLGVSSRHCIVFSQRKTKKDGINLQSSFLSFQIESFSFYRYGYVGGNAGTVKAMDTEKGILYAEICNPPTNPNDDCTLHIAGIDLASSKVVTAPAMQMSSGRQPFILTIAWSSA